MNVSKRFFIFEKR